ncbi:MAG: hypothetical protein PHE41_03045 [Eubacteriales bacterium]|nr:hypothetical protein [Eubacteriales bacterium]
MQLSNSKTKNEIGFDHVVNNINVVTPFGKRRIKEIQPFMPGDEGYLEHTLSQLEVTLDMVEREPRKVDILREVFMEMKDNTFTIAHSANNILTVVELFEIKTLLLQMTAIRDNLISSTIPLPEEFQLHDLLELLNVLDPGKDRLNTFYIYDVFSEKLTLRRREKRKIELDLRKVQKERRRKVEADYGISMTPKFELPVSKADRALIEKVKAIPELMLSEEDYITATFTLKRDETVDLFQMALDEINEAIDEEELAVQKKLSGRIASYRSLLEENCNRIGELDFNLAKALYAKENHCVKPDITTEYLIEINEGRQLVVEEILKRKGKAFCPVTIDLKEGVTCITGANMGGKTVTLKLVGLCAMLAQHGFFVPCSQAKIGLSSYIHILIGDSQNLQRGLSSFGSEMEELRVMLEKSKDRTLLLFDELASGTNPAEGLALTKSLVDYLDKKPYISLITTHFDHITGMGVVRNLQVRGLADANFQNLAREIRYANKRERIEVIGKYMDYRLFEVDKDQEIPKDALNIAGMLGISSEIIEKAKKYMEDRNHEK